MEEGALGGAGAQGEPALRPHGSRWTVRAHGCPQGPELRSTGGGGGQGRGGARAPPRAWGQGSGEDRLGRGGAPSKKGFEVGTSKTCWKEAAKTG